MSKLNIDDINSRCRYIQIDLPFRGVEDELYNYRRPFDKLLEDEEADFPLANYETQRWLAVFDLQKKSIFGWNSSYGSVRIDAKVRDEGIYTLLDSEMQIICRLEGYVPNGVIPPKDGCGDYIRFEVDDKGGVSSLYDEPNFAEFSDKDILPDSEAVNMSNINEVNSILIYSTPDGQHKIEVNLNDDTVWLNLDQIAELFERNKSTISRHIKNIFEQGELEQNSVVAKNATTATDGKMYQVDYYNLDVIISVGYRVNSLRGTHFRMWATQVLREYIVKGFAMDDERLKRGGGGNYFDELLSRIRDIRSSEKLFYRKVLEIYALSIDYDPRSAVTKQFFASVQNKMHYATHGKTAAELIYIRADADKDFMGLTSWSGRLPQKSDAEVAKNYLSIIGKTKSTRFAKRKVHFFCQIEPKAKSV